MSHLLELARLAMATQSRDLMAIAVLGGCMVVFAAYAAELAGV